MLQARAAANPLRRLLILINNRCHVLVIGHFLTSFMFPFFQDVGQAAVYKDKTREIQEKYWGTWCTCPWMKMHAAAANWCSLRVFLQISTTVFSGAVSNHITLSLPPPLLLLLCSSLIMVCMGAHCFSLTSDSHSHAAGIRLGLAKGGNITKGGHQQIKSSIDVR